LIQSSFLSVQKTAVERKNLNPLNRKKPLAESDSRRAAICLDRLGFERTKKEGKRVKESRVRKGASWELPQQSRSIAA